MKCVINPISLNTWLFFLLFLLLFVSYSCHSFKVRTIEPVELTTLKQSREVPNYFVLNWGTRQYQLAHLSIDSSSLFALIDTLTKQAYYNPDRYYSNRRYKSFERSIIHEVHVYLNATPGEELLGNELHIPFDHIEKIEVIDN